jgi:putative drug exporter of the RND superfamily
MSTFLANLGERAFRYRRAVVALWVIVLVGSVLGAIAAGGKTQSTYSVPGTQSQRAADLLTQRFAAVSDGASTAVFVSRPGTAVTSAAARTAIGQAVSRLRTIRGVVNVSAPFASHTVARDGRAALITVHFVQAPASVASSSLSALDSAVAPARAAGLTVDFGGSVYPGYGTSSSTATSEMIGLAIALVVLLLTFGTLVNAAMPLVVALIGVVISFAAIGALSAATTLISAVPTLGIMLGLACGIDYSLFISSRQRAEITAGSSPLLATRTAVGTAGGSVVFAALTVIVALCGLAVTGIPFLTKMGYCAAGAVLIAALAALTLLPALMGFAGPRATHFLSPLRARQRHLLSDPRSAFGARWSGVISAHRLAALAASVLVLLAVAVPALHLRLGLPSAGSDPVSQTQRRAYDEISRNYGVGYNSALVVVIDGPTQQRAAAARQVRQISANLADVAGTTPAQQNPADTLSVLTVIPRTGPEDSATSTLVNTLRARLDTVHRSTGAQVLVGGTAAVNIDTSHKIGQALPTFLAVVIGLALILLTLAFRTILVPLKSAVGFLLSVAASFGIEVAVFQDGFLKGVFGTTPNATVAFLPIILLAVLFGLSSDYEVFVVSRIREAFVREHDARSGVDHGLAASARVVTAAALIMFSVFASFIINNDPIIKPIGLTLAAGVFLDAFLVRMTMVPALLDIVGSRIWYHPRWFDRWVPDFDIEGDRLSASNASRAASMPATPPPGADHRGEELPVSAG